MTMEFEDAMREAMHEYEYTTPRATAASLVTGARTRRMKTRIASSGAVLAVVAIAGATAYWTFGTATKPGETANPAGTPTPSSTATTSSHGPQRSAVKQVVAGEAIAAPGDIAGAFYWMTTDAACRYAPHTTKLDGSADLSTSAYIECDSPLGTATASHPTPRDKFCRVTVTTAPPRTANGVPCTGHPATTSGFEGTGSFDSDFHDPPAGVLAGSTLPVRIDVRAIDAVVGPDITTGGKLVVRSTSEATLYKVPGMKPGWVFWLPSVPPSYPDLTPGPIVPTYYGAPKPTTSTVTNSYDDVWLFDEAGHRISSEK
jgi:hypothetical protein